MVMKAEQERNAAVIRAEGESESARLISEATKQVSRLGFEPELPCIMPRRRHVRQAAACGNVRMVPTCDDLYDHTEANVVWPLPANQHVSFYERGQVAAATTWRLRPCQHAFNLDHSNKKAQSSLKLAYLCWPALGPSSCAASEVACNVPTAHITAPNHAFEWLHRRLPCSLLAHLQAGPGFIELRRIEAARDVADTLAKSRNVVYLPGGGNMLLNLNPTAN